MTPEVINRLTAVVAYIKANPKLFTMRDWARTPRHACGTAACIGGTLVLLDGWTPKYARELDDYAGNQSASFAQKGNVVERIENLATYLLDMTARDASALFFRSNWPQKFLDIADDEDEAAAAVVLLTAMIEGEYRINDGFWEVNTDSGWVYSEADEGDADNQTDA